MWSLWLSPSDGVAAQCRVACEPQTGRAHLAPRGAEGAAKAAEARSALAERRIMHPASARVSGPCLVLRLRRRRSEEHTSELQSLMRISSAVFCLKKKNNRDRTNYKPK